MSSLITKATKRSSSASKKIRATKGKKAPSRKLKRPGRITAAPKAKKAAVVKKLPQAKKSRQATAAKKLTSRRIKKVVPRVVPKKKRTVSPARRSKVAVAKRPSPKKGASKSMVVKKRAAKPQSRKAMLARRRALIPRPLPAPPKKPPSPGTLAAVRAFEQALRLFNRQDFSTAKSAFLSLLGKFAEQAEIVARVRTYLAICEQRLARSPSVPRNADALYNQGVFQLNKDNTAEALELFEKALKVEPRADHIYYSLAAAYARLNDVAKAMEALRRAIGLRPVHRSHARRDLDFAGLRSNEDFQQLTGFGFDLLDE
jgi:tetratricopeptide (TPR) repeat protein